MWFFVTAPGRFRAKLYLHPKEPYFGLRAENLKTSKFPRISWRVSAFLNHTDCRQFLGGLLRLLGNIQRKHTKKTYKFKKEKNLVQLTAPIVIRCVRKRIRAAKNNESTQ